MNKDCSYAFGNGANDLEMLKNVGHPYAMHNSETELLRAIKSVTDDVLDDGVYKQLKKLLKRRLYLKVTLKRFLMAV